MCWFVAVYACRCSVLDFTMKRMEKIGCGRGGLGRSQYQEYSGQDAQYRA